MTTPQFILPFIVQKVEGDEGLAFITDSGDMDTVRCITEEMPLEEAQWLCDRLNASTATASEAARRAAEEIATLRRDGEPDFRSHTEYAAWAAAIISKHFPTSKARAALADAIEEVAKWHERQAFDVESEHPGVQGSKSQKRRKRFHNESAATLRTLPAAQPTKEWRCRFCGGLVTFDGTAPEQMNIAGAPQKSRQPAAVPEALSSQQADQPSKNAILRAALRGMMDAYERRVRSGLVRQEDIKAEPWRCMEYIAAEEALKLKLLIGKNFIREMVARNPDGDDPQAGPEIGQSSAAPSAPTGEKA